MAANPASSLEYEIVSVAIGTKLVKLAWSDASQQDIHPAFLRHSPGFPGGKRPAGPTGRFPFSGLEPSHGEITDSGDLRIHWHPSGLKSLHRAEWLRAHFESSKLRAENPPGQVVWDAALIERLPQPAHADLADDESARLQLFEQVLNWGVALIRDVPAQAGAVESVAGWFGQSQPNAYADDPARPALASIRVDPSQPVATRMSHFLGPHTDTCWRQTLVGLLMIHCLQAHPAGGRSMLVDGFSVAARLREESPEAFELLCTVPIAFDAVVSDSDEWRAQGRIISLSADGVVEGIRYNGNSIGQLVLPDHLVDPVYSALQRFEGILYDRDLWWRPMLGPGDLLVIDNHRVLHGREAFDTTAGERHLQCCSVERDHFHNNYRRLARSRGVENWDRRLSAGVI